MKKVFKKTGAVTGAAVLGASLFVVPFFNVYGEVTGDTEDTYIIECDSDKINEVSSVLEEEDVAVGDVLEIEDTSFIQVSLTENEKEKIEDDKNVESVGEDHKLYLMGNTASSLNDTYKNDIWHFDNINTGGAWDVLGKTSGRKKVRVAVIDSGVERSHSDLKGVVKTNKCMIYGDDNYEKNESSAVSLHGTHIAGIIGATSNNKNGIAGVASYNNDTVEIYSYRVFDKNISLDGKVSVSAGEMNVANAIIYAVEKDGCKVINLSLGSDTEVPIVKAACEYAGKKGCTVIAAGGNEGKNSRIYPGDYDSAISVIAATYGKDPSKPSQNRRAYFSSYGGKDISAPGKSIYSTEFNNGYRESDGSSQAAGMVTAVVAMICSVRPDLKQDDIKSIITSTATDIGSKGYDAETAWGNINAGKALEKAKTYKASAAKKTGWVNENGRYKYYGSDGKAYTGWHWMTSQEGEKTDHWSYFGPDGCLRTGWQKMGTSSNPDGKAKVHWSYFGPNGWLRTGWQKMGTSANPDGNAKVHWSYFGPNGWLRTDWQQMGTSSNPDGNAKVHWSYFGPNGWLRTGWQTMGTAANPDGKNKVHKSYFGDNGWLRTGKVYIGGKAYTFDNRGWLK